MRCWRRIRPSDTTPRAVSQRPQFYGVKGSPDQTAEMNQRIKLARSTLDQLTAQYGDDRARAILAKQNPEAYRLAVVYEPLDRDLLWFRQQQERKRLGILTDPGDITIPDFGTGAATVSGAGRFNRLNLPPGLR
jgi:hypothetical protein